MALCETILFRLILYKLYDYDYENDPLEKVNLAADEWSHPLMRDMAKALRDDGVGCPML